jgi:hypothetical protein
MAKVEIISMNKRNFNNNVNNLKQARNDSIQLNQNSVKSKKHLNKGAFL